MNINKLLNPILGNDLFFENVFPNIPCQSATNNLPNEVLSTIFAATSVPVKTIAGSGYDTTNLDSIACVSKRWNRLCGDLFEGPYVHLFKKQFSEHTLFSLNNANTARNTYKKWVMRSQGDTERVAWNAVVYDLELLLSKVIHRIDFKQRYFIWNWKSIENLLDNDELELELDFATFLGIAVIHGSIKSLKFLLEYPEVDYNEVTNDENNCSILQYALILNEKYDIAAAIKVLLENKRVKLEYPREFSEIDSIDFLTEFTEVLTKREPKELVALFDRSILPLIKHPIIADEHIAAFANIVKNIGVQRFGNFYYHILSLVDNASIKEEVKRIRLHDVDELGFSLYNIIIKYKNLKLFSNLTNLLVVYDVKRIFVNLLFFNESLNNPIEASNYCELFEKAISRNDFDKQSILKFYNDLVEFSPHKRSLHDQLFLVLKNVLKLTTTLGNKRPLESSFDVEEPECKKKRINDTHT